MIETVWKTDWLSMEIDMCHSRIALKNKIFLSNFSSNLKEVRLFYLHTFLCQCLCIFHILDSRRSRPFAQFQVERYLWMKAIKNKMKRVCQHVTRGCNTVTENRSRGGNARFYIFELSSNELFWTFEVGITRDVWQNFLCVIISKSKAKCFMHYSKSKCRNICKNCFPFLLLLF